MSSKSFKDLNVFNVKHLTPCLLNADKDNLELEDKFFPTWAD
jgi:hypothetical protein